MAEEIISMGGPDGNVIYGRYGAHGNKRLVVHIHGLIHHASTYLEVMSSEFFQEQGYDHYRPTLYGPERDTRRLPQSTLTTHVRDIQAILDFFRSRYDEIFITAHSLGGLVMFMMNPQGIKAMSLWDPSTDVMNFWNSASYLTYLPQLKAYAMDYGSVYLIGEAMVEEIKNYPDAKCLELAKAITTPTQLVIPDEGISLASPHVSMENYANAFAGPFDFHRVMKANHLLSNRGNRQDVFKASLDWFNKHSRI